VFGAEDARHASSELYQAIPKDYYWLRETQKDDLNLVFPHWR